MVYTYLIFPIFKDDLNRKLMVGIGQKVTDSYGPNYFFVYDVFPLHSPMNLNLYRL